MPCIVDMVESSRNANDHYLENIKVVFIHNYLHYPGLRISIQNKKVTSFLDVNNQEIFNEIHPL